MIVKRYQVDTTYDITGRGRPGVKGGFFTRKGALSAVERERECLIYNSWVSQDAERKKVSRRLALAWSVYLSDRRSGEVRTFNVFGEVKS